MHFIKNLLLFALVLFVAPYNARAEEPWIIDPHTHFKGEAQIAHESKTNKRHPKDTLGMVVTPEDYRALADRLGIQATLIVEAVDQDQPQFNDSVLAQAKSDLVCGYVARGPVLDPCFDAFGEDRVIFATNWGVCEHFGKVDDVVRIVREFLASKGDAVLKKGMRENAIRIYGVSADKLR